MDNTLKSLYTERKPKTYTEVFTLFESNYQKILKLVPKLEKITNNAVICHHNEQDLHLLIENKTPYTAAFVLTHKFDTINRPNIRFKVYFDAKLLEVLSVCNETILNKSHPYLRQCSDMNIRWELNNFMEKWIAYCLEKYQGSKWQTK